MRGKHYYRSRLFRMALREGLRMLPRFPAEPVFRNTGKGRMKSLGVRHLQKLKAREHKSPKSRNETL